MEHGKWELGLLLLSILCLLFVGKASFAIDDSTLVDECTYWHCDGWDCITWGEGNDNRFCWCTNCEDAELTSGLYQVGQDQYVCGPVPNSAGLASKCARFPFQTKSLDINDTQVQGTDKAAVNEIRRLKGLNAIQKVQTIAPTEATTPIQQPTKSPWPVFWQKSVPSTRQIR